MITIRQRTENPGYGYWERKKQQACPLCEGVGFRMVERYGQVHARKCRCISPERVSTLQKQSRIPVIYWNQGLEDLKPRSLEGISLVDSLKDILNERELAAVRCWVVSGPDCDTEETLFVFASELIRVCGLSSVWLDCQEMAAASDGLNSKGTESWVETARAVDFVFLTNCRPALLRTRQQRALEDVLRDRLRDRKSTLIIARAPLSGCAELFFQDPKLASAFLNEFRILGTSRPEGKSRHSHWLF